MSTSNASPVTRGFEDIAHYSAMAEAAVDLEQNRARRSASPAAHELRTALTPRECEILELTAEGQSNKSIARQLGLGPETVKIHLKKIFARLSVERRTQAVLRAEELGFVRIRRSLR